MVTDVLISAFEMSRYVLSRMLKYCVSSLKHRWRINALFLSKKWKDAVGYHYFYGVINAVFPPKREG